MRKNIIASISSKWGQFLETNIFWVLTLISIWIIVGELKLINPLFLPKPSTVLTTLYQELFNGGLWLQILNSLRVLIIGFSLSLLIVLLMIAFSLLSKISKYFLTAVTNIFNMIPNMALMPLIIMCFGIKTKSIIFLICLGTVLNMYQQLIVGIENIPKVYIDLALNLELNLWQKIRHVYFFAILPNVMSSLRIAWGRAWRALISAEIVFGMIGTIGGIGYFISIARIYGRMDKVMAGVIIVVIIGVLVENLIFRLVEKTVSKWRGENA